MNVKREARRRLIRYLVRGGRVTRSVVGSVVNWGRATCAGGYGDVGERLKRTGFTYEGQRYRIRKEPKTRSTYRAVAQR